MRRSKNIVAEIRSKLIVEEAKFRDIQFEWAWQHPVESLAVRKAAANFKSLSRVANKIKLAYTILTYHLGRA
ncbi:hypothetical protein HN51_043814 [Arachis hypogaea]